MDGFELVARSEWPALVAAGMYAFRKELRHLLLHVKKATVMGNEVEIDQSLDRAEQLENNIQVSSPGLAATTATLTVSEAPDDALALGYVQPDTAGFPSTYIPSVQVASAWTSLLAHMKQLYERDGNRHGSRRLKWREPGPFQDLAAELGLTPAEVGAFTEMQALTYRIMNAPTPFVTGREAKRYQAVISSLQKKMKLPEAG